MFVKSILHSSSTPAVYAISDHVIVLSSFSIKWHLKALTILMCPGGYSRGFGWRGNLLDLTLLFMVGSKLIP